MPNGEQQAQDRYEPHELVVELPHRDLIRTKIGALGITVKEPAPEERARYESDELGLALIDRRRPPRSCRRAGPGRRSRRQVVPQNIETGSVRLAEPAPARLTGQHSPG